MMMMRSQMFFGPRSGVRRGPFLKVVIFEFQRGMLYREGRFIRVLEPGRYLLRARDTLVRPVDIRPAFVTIPGQEVLSSDGVTLKVSIVAQYEVADLDVAFNKTQDAMSALYLTLQMALRDIVGGAKIDELLENRSRFAGGLVQAATEPIGHHLADELAGLGPRNRGLHADANEAIGVIHRLPGVAGIDRDDGVRVAAALVSLIESCSVIHQQLNHFIPALHRSAH